MMSWVRRFWLPLMVLLYAGAIGRPAWNKVTAAKHGRDYATYHYATKVAFDGGDPYDVSALSTLSRQENTRRAVHPYFYPPPFLLSMAWVGDLTLKQGAQIYFGFNHLLLVGVFLVFWGWFRAPPWLLGLLLVTFTPIPDNAVMGQANLIVLFLLVLGLWKTAGPLVSTAAMFKMSPAIFVGKWVFEGRWRPAGFAMVFTLALSAAALPLVGPDHQIRFYTEVLPSFSSGAYHGLSIPISLPANHSVADVFNRVWPGASKQVLSDTARHATMVANLGVLTVLCAVVRRRRDPLGDACLAGAFVVLMVVSPVYTYEHHLVFLLLPLAALGTAAAHGRLSRPAMGLALLVYFFLAWPLTWIRTISDWMPSMEPWFYETKFIGELLLLVMCVVVGLRSPLAEEQT